MAVHGDRPPATGGGGGDGGLDRAAVDVRVRSAANAATTAQRGNVELADQAEARAGVDDTLAMTPLRVKDVIAQTNGRSGLDQNQVDARIDALIPASRRVPSYGAGDAGQSLQVNGDGTGLHFAPERAGSSYRGDWSAETTYAKGEIVSSDAKFYISAASNNLGNAVSSATHWSEISAEEITEQAVYDDAKDIIVGGHGISAATDDATRRITLSADGVPSGLNLPASPHVGDRFRLLQAETIARDRTLTFNEANSTPTVVRWDIADPPATGPQYLVSYGAGHANPSYRNKTYLVTAGAYSMPADMQVAFYRTGQSRTLHNVADTADAAIGPHAYLVDGLTFAEAGQTQTQYRYFFNYEAGGSAYYPAQTIPAGDYTFAGGVHGIDGWLPTPSPGDMVSSAWSVMAAPAAAVTVRGAAPSVSGAWGGWTTIVQTAALTSAQTGLAIAVAHSHMEADANAADGAGRLLTETRIVRQRGGADTVLSDNVDYGPRRVPPNAGNTSTSFAAGSLVSDEEHVAVDDAEQGDVYLLQMRLNDQRVSGSALTATATIAGNSLDVASLAGARGDKGDKGDQGDPGAYRSMTQAAYDALQPAQRAGLIVTT